MTTAQPCRAPWLAPAWEGSKPQHVEEGCGTEVGRVQLRPQSKMQTNPFNAKHPSQASLRALRAEQQWRQKRKSQGSKSPLTPKYARAV